jgi:hypothetical protein
VWSTNSTFELQPDGTEHGHFFEAFWRFDAAQAYAPPPSLVAYTASQDYAQCVVKQFADDIARYPPPGHSYQQVGTTIQPYPIQLPGPGDAWLITVSERIDDTPRTSTKVRVHLYTPTYAASMSFQWCTCAPFPDTSIPGWVQMAHDRLPA